MKKLLKLLKEYSALMDCTVSISFDADLIGAFTVPTTGRLYCFDGLENAEYTIMDMIRTERTRQNAG